MFFYDTIWLENKYGKLLLFVSEVVFLKKES